MSRCRKCPGRIVWARTDAGKAMPLDANPDPAVVPTPVNVPDGNVAVLATGEVDGQPTYLARVLRSGEAPTPDEWCTVAHFATCPGWSR